MRIELRLRHCLPAVPLEAISDEDWLHTYADRDNNIRLAKRRRKTYVIMNSRRQQVRTKQRLHFTSLTLFMPHCFVMMRDK